MRAGSVCRNRGRMELLASIVSAAKGGARMTNVLYRANLNLGQLRRYLPLLEDRGLLRVTGGHGRPVVYESTERGLEFLRDYERLVGYL